MTTFRFHGSDGSWNDVWTALACVMDPDALLEMAVARLRAETRDVELDGKHIVVNEDAAGDVEARARELVRVSLVEDWNLLERVRVGRIGD